MRQAKLKMGALISTLIFITVSGHFGYADVPASFIINGAPLTSSQISGMGEIPNTCTVTLIGPKTVVTAAHCVAGSGQRSADLVFRTSNGQSYNAAFFVDPLYDVEDDGPLNIPYDFASKHDIALGILDSTAEGVDPVTITADEPEIGGIVLFAGRGAPTYARMYGWAKMVTVSPIGFTERGFGESPQTLDGGDSGGPSFLVDRAGHLKMFAVHSTSTRTADERDTLNWPEALPYTMGDSRLLMKDGTSFLSGFIAANSLEICGINLDCAPVSAP